MLLLLFELFLLLFSDDELDGGALELSEELLFESLLSCEDDAEELSDDELLLEDDDIELSDELLLEDDGTELSEELLSLLLEEEEELPLRQGPR